MSGGSSNSIIDKYQIYKKKYLDPGIIIPKNDLREVRSFIEGKWGSKPSWYDAYKLAEQGDFSQFEKVDPLGRAFLASVYMDAVLSDERGEALFAPEKSWNRDRVTEILQKEKKNPLFRLGCSLLSKTNFYSDARKNFKYRTEGEKDPKSRIGEPIQINELYQKYDDRMTDMLMEDTLNPLTEDQIKNVRAMAENEAKADAMIHANIEKQVQVAKMLFLTHVGKTTVVTTSENGTVSKELDRSVSSMVSHCSRTGFVFAPGDDKAVSAMMDAVLGSSTGAAAGVYGRFAATHSTANGPDIQHYKEMKGVCLRKQYGMDLAIGGLGNPGISVLDGKMPKMPSLLAGKEEEVSDTRKESKNPQILKNDGSCGHMYMHINKGGRGQTSSLLVGFESDAPGKMNQQGHTHNKSATGEYMSSFLGQRTDEMGDKYGGRTVDCTMYTPEDLKRMVEEFASHYRGLMYDAVKNPAARERVQEANRMLAGTVMEPKHLQIFFNKAGLSAEKAQEYTGMVANAKGKAYERAVDVSMKEAESLPEMKKPGLRTKIKAAFGSERARERINLFKAAVIRKKESVKVSFTELSREDASVSKSSKTATKSTTAKNAITKRADEKKAPVKNPFGKKPFGF